MNINEKKMIDKYTTNKKNTPSSDKTNESPPTVNKATIDAMVAMINDNDGETLNMLKSMYNEKFEIENKEESLKIEKEDEEDSLKTENEGQEDVEVIVDAKTA